MAGDKENGKSQEKDKSEIIRRAPMGIPLDEKVISKKTPRPVIDTQPPPDPKKEK